ncbi:hypothetical protein JL101_030865 (plasmid) [Skermanella rosea]|uniref:hypothetical protein n=1 Tax=Skermanella rosea TaxID=1817965 RepID=UPI0019347394|nr:hypothetical protein [Skermanella rosea]UEM06888.1 hypothetical protein JL101_030865 [Skermanella rosea]
MILFRLVLAALMLVATALVSPSIGNSAQQADGKNAPPACGAVSFRPLPPGMADGEQQSGLYRSRFGSVVVMAKVQGGQPTDYYMQLNGKTPEPFTAAVPKSADGCLKSKSVKLPVAKAEGACVGSRFRVVLDRSTQQPLAMLFALQGGDWKLCSAAKA